MKSQIHPFWLKEKAATNMVWTLYRMLGGDALPADRVNALIKWHAANIERIKNEIKVC